MNQKNNHKEFHLNIPALPLNKPWIIMLVLSFIVGAVLLILSTSSTPFNRVIAEKSLETQKVAPYDLVLQEDIQFIDQEATRIRREATAALVSPVYKIDMKITEDLLDQFDRFVKWSLVNDVRNDRDNRLFRRLQSEFPSFYEMSEIPVIRPYLENPRRLKGLWQGYSSLLEKGIVRLEDEYHPDASDIEYWDGSSFHKILQQDLLVLAPGNTSIYDYILREIPEDNPKVIYTILVPFIKENVFFDQEETDRQRSVAMNSVESTYVHLRGGTKVLRKGFSVTDEDKQIIYNILQKTRKFDFFHILGVILSLLVVFFLSLILFHYFNPRKLSVKEFNTLLFLTWTYLLTYLAFTIWLKESNIPYYIWIPTALFTILISILLSREVGFIFALIFSFIPFTLGEFHLSHFLFTFFSGIFGTLVVRSISKRIHIIRAGIYLGFAQMIFYGVILIFTKESFKDSLIYFINTLGAGFLWGILTLGFLPILEHILNWPTSFRLLELSDLNAPILKRMLNLAPGTYSHSVNVANLAESACLEIGSNSLLARVGGYYHDIGKIDQAEFFIENQKGVNKHDELRPSMSATILKSHVKIGVEKAQELGLPQAVIDIIAQHHGRGLMKYFYSKSKNEQKDSPSPEEYIYAGPNPQTKEAAVVLLADTVEAATRTLKKPTLRKLEKYVWDLIMTRFEDGVLGECNLSFKDLEAINDIFVKILAGYFHTRIEYPEE